MDQQQNHGAYAQNPAMSDAPTQYATPSPSMSPSSGLAGQMSLPGFQPLTDDEFLTLSHNASQTAKGKGKQRANSLKPIRKRLSRACDHCNAGSLKCSLPDENGNCERCLRYDTPVKCTWNRPQLQRGTKSKNTKSKKAKAGKRKMSVGSDEGYGSNSPEREQRDSSASASSSSSPSPSSPSSSSGNMDHDNPQVITQNFKRAFNDFFGKVYNNYPQAQKARFMSQLFRETCNRDEGAFFAAYHQDFPMDPSIAQLGNEDVDMAMPAMAASGTSSMYLGHQANATNDTFQMDQGLPVNSAFQTSEPSGDADTGPRSFDSAIGMHSVHQIDSGSYDTNASDITHFTPSINTPQIVPNHGAVYYNTAYAGGVVNMNPGVNDGFSADNAPVYSSQPHMTDEVSGEMTAYLHSQCLQQPEA